MDIGWFCLCFIIFNLKYGPNLKQIKISVYILFLWIIVEVCTSDSKNITDVINMFVGRNTGICIYIYGLVYWVLWGGQQYHSVDIALGVLLSTMKWNNGNKWYVYFDRTRSYLHIDTIFNILWNVVWYLFNSPDKFRPWFAVYSVSDICLFHCFI